MSDDARQRVLLGLAKRDLGSVAQTMAAITEASAEVLDVARVSVWRLVEGREIVCEDLFVRQEGRHTNAGSLSEAEYPAYFAALCEQRAITASDALRDPRTAAMEPYLRPLGITSMMDVPIWHREEVYGVLCHEHVGAARAWTPDEVAFATNLADIVSVSLAAAERQAVERRWQTVVEAIPDGVMVVRTDGTIERMNPTMREFLDSAGEGTLEERVQLLDCVDVQGHPLPPDRNPFRRVLLCGERVTGEIVGVRLLQSDPHRYLRLTVTALTDDGDTSALVVVISDISDELRFEHLKRDFLDALAHELKTPVAIAKGYAVLLSRTASLADPQVSMLSAISRATDRMDRLIQGLLDVSNLLLGKLSFDREPVALAAVVARVVEQVTESARSPAVHLVVRADPYVRGDILRIEQAFRQILDNAVRYSPEGSTVTVTVDHPDEGQVRIQVRDEGPGIAPNRLDRVFDLFHGTSADSGETGGLGVGLYLAREIARRHAGDVTVDSAPGAGTTVTLALREA